MAMRRAAWLLLALAPMADALVAPSARTASRRAALRASRSDRKYRWIEKEYSKAAAEEWLQAQARDASKYDSKRAAAFGAEAGEEYDLEYGTDKLEIHRDAIHPGERILIIDDVLATGGTAAATTKLVETLGGTVSGLGFMIELDDLGGRSRLGERQVATLLHY